MNYQDWLTQRYKKIVCAYVYILIYMKLLITTASIIIIINSIYFYIFNIHLFRSPSWMNIVALESYELLSDNNNRATNKRSCPNLYIDLDYSLHFACYWWHSSSGNTKRLILSIIRQIRNILVATTACPPKDT